MTSCGVTRSPCHHYLVTITSSPVLRHHYLITGTWSPAPRHPYLTELQKGDAPLLGDLQVRRFGRGLDQTRVDQLLRNSRWNVLSASLGCSTSQPEYVFEIDAFLFHVQAPSSRHAPRMPSLCTAGTAECSHFSRLSTRCKAFRRRIASAYACGAPARYSNQATTPAETCVRSRRRRRAPPRRPRAKWLLRAGRRRSFER